MSVKNVIRDNIPFTWEQVLREERVFSKFIDYCYEHNILEAKRNAKFASANTVYLKRILFHYDVPDKCISPNSTKEGREFWLEISEKVRILNESYK